jgi:hypothetical protein
MGILFLARHAQASFLEHNYDKLSVCSEKRKRAPSANIGRGAIWFSTAHALAPAFVSKRP